MATRVGDRLINDYINSVGPSARVNEVVQVIADNLDKLNKDFQDYVIEQYLLGDEPERPKDVYKMSYDEYSQLDGNVRL